jgi:hypothetical protein
MVRVMLAKAQLIPEGEGWWSSVPIAADLTSRLGRCQGCSTSQIIGIAAILILQHLFRLWKTLPIACQNTGSCRHGLNYVFESHCKI